MRWTAYTFIRLVFFLITGILFHISTGLYFTWLIGVFLSLMLIYLLWIAFAPSHLQFKWSAITGILACILIFIFGWVRTHQSTASYDSNHIIHQDSITAYTCVMDAEIQDKNKNLKTEAEIQEIQVKNQWKKAKGRILLYFKKDSLQSNQKIRSLKYGDKILVVGNLLQTQSLKNPLAFDYAQYLKYQNIYHQDFVSVPEFQKIGFQPRFWVVQFAMNWRQYFDKVIQKYIVSEQENAIASALVLGVKDRLDDDILQAYSRTGLMHVLAVSGMHVGILLSFLWIVLGKLQKIPKIGDWVYALSILAILWLYAFITGLSASVLRAVVMFSFITLGKAMNKRGTMYNTLAFSAFVLLMYNPYFILSAGFQLSYLAVLGIVYLTPRMESWFDISNSFLKQGWQLICVSLAAQLATAPLSLLYFHQFPTYFLIANLLILPLNGSMLYAGILLLMFSWLPWVNQALGWFLWLLFKIMNQITFWIESLPFSIIEGIYLEDWEVALLYAVIILMLMLFHYRSFQYLVYAFVCLLMIVGHQIYRTHQQNQQNILVIYHISKQPHINLISGRKSYFLADPSLQKDTKSLSFSVQNFLYSKGIVHSEFKAWKTTKSDPVFYQDFDKFGVLVWHKKTFLILKKYLKYKELQALSDIQTDYLVVQNNALYSLETLLEFYEPKYLILDASSSFHRNEKLAKEAQSYHIPCYDILQKGAFVLNLK
jgi:competence protein ComEC